MGRRRLKDKQRKVDFICQRLPLEVPLLGPGYESTHMVVTLERDVNFDYFWANIHGERRRSWQNLNIMSFIFFEKYGNGVPKYTQTNRIFLYVVPVDITYEIAAGPKPMMWLTWLYQQCHLQRHPLMDVNLLRLVRKYISCQPQRPP